MNESILLIGNYENDKQKSMVAYANLLNKSLSQAGFKSKIAVPGCYFGRIKDGVTGFGKFLGYLDKFIIFPFVLLYLQMFYDRVHVCDHSNSIYKFFIYKKSSVTCHDVIAIQAAKGIMTEWRVGLFGRFFQFMIFVGLIRFEEIYCVSIFTKNELLSLNSKIKNKCKISYNSLNMDFKSNENWYSDVCSIVANKFIDDGYFIHVGSGHARKNRILIVEICNELRDTKYKNANFIFVGPDPDEQMKKLIDQYGVGEKFIFINNVSHAQLVSLYSGALALIFPSLYEGFGWPVIEAQACGCPVFASDSEPMPEIGGAAAKYFHVKNVIAARKIICDSDFDSMKELGLRNLHRFSLSSMIDAFRG